MSGGVLYKFNVIYRRSLCDEDGARSLRFTEYITNLLETERRLGPGYYADRDALVGTNVFDETFRVINSSRFTIVVLTSKFIRNSWNLFWQQAAFRTVVEQGQRLESFRRFLPIGLGINSKEVEEHCQNLILSEVLFVPEAYETQNGWADKLISVLKDNILVSQLSPTDPGTRGPVVVTARSSTASAATERSLASSPEGKLNSQLQPGTCFSALPEQSLEVDGPELTAGDKQPDNPERVPPVGQPESSTYVEVGLPQEQMEQRFVEDLDTINRLGMESVDIECTPSMEDCQTLPKVSWSATTGEDGFMAEEEAAEKDYYVVSSSSDATTSVERSEEELQNLQNESSVSCVSLNEAHGQAPRVSLDGPSGRAQQLAEFYSEQAPTVVSVSDTTAESRDTGDGSEDEVSYGSSPPYSMWSFLDFGGDSD